MVLNYLVAFNPTPYDLSNFMTSSNSILHIKKVKILLTVFG